MLLEQAADDDGSRDQDHEQTLAVEDKLRRSGFGAAAAADDEQQDEHEHGRRDGIPHARAHDAAHLRALRVGRGDGRVRDGREVVAEQRAGDERAGHDGRVDAREHADREQHRERDDICADRGARRHGQHAADEKADAGEQAAADAGLYDRVGQRADEAARRDELARDGREDDRHGNDGKDGPAEALDRRLAVGGHVFGKRRADDDGGEERQTVAVDVGLMRARNDDEHDRREQRDVLSDLSEPEFELGFLHVVFPSFRTTAN